VPNSGGRGSRQTGGESWGGPNNLRVEVLEDRGVPAGILSVVPFTSLDPQPTEGAAFTGQVATPNGLPIVTGAPQASRLCCGQAQAG
jgi:hypothetical protein